MVDARAILACEPYVQLFEGEEMNSALFAKSILIILTCCTLAHAVQVPTAEDNAALWYWQVFYSSQNLNPDIDQAAGAVLDSNGEDEQACDAVRNHVAAHWETLQTAASKPHCAFGVKWDEGWSAVLPHLNPMRGWAQLLCADALCQIQAGEHSVAAERLATALIMADHMAQESFVISYLVAAAMVGGAEEVFPAIDPDALSEESRKALVNAIGSSSSIDVERAAEIVRVEGKVMRMSLKSRWSGEGGRQRMAEDLGMIVDLEGNSPPGVDHDSIDKQFELWTTLDKHIAAALRAGDQQRMNELVSAIGDGEYGSISRIFYPSIEQLYKTAARTEARLKRMRDALVE